MFWVFSNKKRLEEAREETKKGFESVKKDMFSISEWIKHLDLEKNAQKEDITQIKSILSSIKEELEDLRERVEVADVLGSNSQIKQPFKTNSHLLNKQTTDFDVQTGVQTGVQTPNLANFSITERAIIGVLLNSDMKLSYEDLATLLNKEKSTIRGQINSIKSKSESLIEESIEKNGKKRVYITKEMKEKLLKKAKVRVKEKKKQEKEE
jgi:ElaB/YqjD/DUF883 family membrane-anchored ribosome-binding protein